MVTSVKELFDAIVVFEKNVGQLYDSISEDVRKQFGVFFENMAQDEYRHAKIYQALGERAQNEDITLSDPGEVAYVQSLIEGTTFDKEGNFLANAKKVKSKHQVLDMAEKVEREAIQYVYELARLFPDFAKDQVAILLQEEQKHLQMVLDRKKEATVGYIGL
ncbi:MAG TPA: hypothetical protein GXZ74_08060 [Tissierellia bacterium]|nr:hypothetical protein [Tissierellia bacterium]